MRYEYTDQVYGFAAAGVFATAVLLWLASRRGPGAGAELDGAAGPALEDGAGPELDGPEHETSASVGALVLGGLLVAGLLAAGI